MVILGVLGKPFGLKGEIYFYPFNPQIHSLSANSTVLLKQPDTMLISEAKIEKFRWHNDSCLLKFHHINSKEEAAKYSLYELAMKRNQLPVLSDNEFYLNDVLGFDVLEEDGNEVIGQVMGFTVNNANQSIMNIKMIKNQFLEILVHPFVKKVDLQARRCYIIIPEYEE